MMNCDTLRMAVEVRTGDILVETRSTFVAAAVEKLPDQSIVEKL